MRLLVKDCTYINFQTLKQKSSLLILNSYKYFTIAATVAFINLISTMKRFCPKNMMCVTLLCTSIQVASSQPPHVQKRIDSYHMSPSVISSPAFNPRSFLLHSPTLTHLKSHFLVHLDHPKYKMETLVAYKRK